MDTKISLTEFWKDESDFKKWLVQKEALDLVGTAIDTNITILKTNIELNSFVADILAEDTNTKKKLIIQSWLESTNNDSLGKLITYSSGAGADTAVWIATEVRDEHKLAVDWLNAQGLKFYLLTIEIQQTDDLNRVPKFTVVSRPKQ